MNRSDAHSRSIAEVTGYHVHVTDESIGYIENFLIDSEKWVVRYLVIDTSIWWFGQHVLISSHAVREVDWTDARASVDVSGLRSRMHLCKEVPMKEARMTAKTRRPTGSVNIQPLDKATICSGTFPNMRH